MGRFLPFSAKYFRWKSGRSKYISRGGGKLEYGFFPFVLRTYNLLIEKFPGKKGRLEKVIVMWKPVWYELDQAIVAREIDYYYLSKDGRKFVNGEASTQDQEVFAIAVRITHPELGTVSGILTNGLSYKVFLESVEIIYIDAEENTGQVDHPADCEING